MDPFLFHMYDGLNTKVDTFDKRIAAVEADTPFAIVMTYMNRSFTIEGNLTRNSWDDFVPRVAEIMQDNEDHFAELFEGVMQEDWWFTRKVDGIDTRIVWETDDTDHTMAQLGIERCDPPMEFTIRQRDEGQDIPEGQMEGHDTTPIGPSGGSQVFVKTLNGKTAWLI